MIMPKLAASIWFEIWGVVGPGKKIDFSRQISEKNSFFSGNFTKQFRYFPGKNWPFTATSGQIILFLFKSHHFRTYFLYMIRYNNISRPHDPMRPPRSSAQNLRVATPNSPGLKSLAQTKS